MHQCKESLLLYAVTDKSWLRGATLYEQVEEALKGGATFVQLRDKELTGEALLKEARELKELCQRYQVPFVMNDNVEAALQVDADGVHVGQSDMEASEARKRLGEGKLIGVTVRTVEQALRAEASGADYLGAGAVFSTGTKKDAVVMERKTLRAICGAVDIPVIAIGGINASNMLELQGNGLSGVAVVSALFARQDIRVAARDLRALAEELVRQAAK